MAMVILILIHYQTKNSRFVRLFPIKLSVFPILSIPYQL